MTSISKDISHDHHQHHSDSNDIFGFWLYILTDCILFSCLFATYVVLQHNTFGGPPLKDLFELPYVLIETILLLLSSFTYGLAILALYKNNKAGLITSLIITFLLGLGFVAMEINEFVQLCAEGHSWTSNGALSAFFTLVGTHGLHVSIGLLWMLITIIQVAGRRLGIGTTTNRRLVYLGLFWHFLDIVWIFVFTIVYLMGAA